MISPQQWDDFDNKQLEQLAKKDAASSRFVEAIRAARGACKSAGLDAVIGENGQFLFTPEQTAIAVRYAREDASATLMLQLFVLRRLDRNRNYMCLIIAILAYIAWQIK